MRAREGVSLNGNVINELPPTGSPLRASALASKSSYQQTRAVIQPGESILFCSGGVVRVRNDKGQIWEQRLAINLGMPTEDWQVINKLEAELEISQGRNGGLKTISLSFLLERDREP